MRSYLAVSSLWKEKKTNRQRVSLMTRDSPPERAGGAEHEVRLAAQAVEDAGKLDGDVAGGVGRKGGGRR